jgi:hypothetical protein
MLGIPLLWPGLMEIENVETKNVKQAVGSHLRVKRGWVWNQFFVPEEMNTSHHIGRVLISQKITLKDDVTKLYTHAHTHTHTHTHTNTQMHTYIIYIYI